MVTQVEIARACGLDVSTCNKILNKVHGPVFRKETIRMVFAKAKELGYKGRVSGKGAMRAILEKMFPRHTDANSDPNVLAQARGVSVLEVVRIQRMLYGEPDFKL